MLSHMLLPTMQTASGLNFLILSSNTCTLASISALLSSALFLVGAANNVRIAQRKQARQVSVFFRATSPVRAAAAVEKLPEQIRGMRVAHVRPRRRGPGVETHEHADQVGF